MIHACPQRMWYVNDYLIPSMLKQGIRQDDITVHNDTAQAGNLRACMTAFSNCTGDGGTWHIQDDVCICKDFKQRTEQHDQGIVCGFSSAMYDGPGHVGEVPVQDMWFSFPCIRIPDSYARECADWVLRYIIGNPVYHIFWKDGVNDDWCFRAYINQFHKQETAVNLAPNLVDHIDYLIGGGTGKKHRFEKCCAQYWEDDDIVEELKNGLVYNR